jgi:hypothetical protein
LGAVRRAVLCTLLALAMDLSPFVAGVRAGAEVTASPRLDFLVSLIYEESKKKDTKKSRGRPATGVGIQIGTRWPPDIVHLVDEWRRQHPDLPGRPEAIRRLVELGLKVKK